MPEDLLQAHVLAVARDPEPHGPGRDPSAPHAGRRQGHRSQCRRRYRVALAGLPADRAEVRNVKPIEGQKFDLKVDAWGDLEALKNRGRERPKMPNLRSYE